MIRIKLRHYFRIAKIKVHMHYELARLSVAGKLITLAFWMEPRLEQELSKGFTPRQKETANAD
jgi:hypothetical protein